MNTFEFDLAKGLAIEKQLIDFLIKKYPSITVVDKYKGYDIWIPELHKSIEVKSDLKSNETGNILVEIEMYDKPSGLMATTADWWVFYDGNNFVAITPIKIIQCIFDLKLTYREFIGNGDTKPKKAFLIKKDELFRYGKVLDA